MTGWGFACLQGSNALSHVKESKSECKVSQYKKTGNGMKGAIVL